MSIGVVGVPDLYLLQIPKAQVSMIALLSSVFLKGEEFLLLWWRWLWLRKIAVISPLPLPENETPLR